MAPGRGIGAEGPLAELAWTAPATARKLTRMFRRLRDAIDRALSRLEGGGVTREEIDRLLSAMREELIERKANLPKLEENIGALERERAAERRRAEDCVRRAEQAQKISDTETVEVAESFARKHLSRVEVLERKAEAARAELAMEREEVERMTQALKDAVARRDVLAVQSRRAGAMDRTRSAGREAIEEFERIFEGAGRSGDVAEAARELDRELGGPAADAARGREMDRELDRTSREAEADAMLRELKRRMGMEE